MSGAKWAPGEPIELGDGLVVRWSTAADTDRIVDLTSQVFRSGPEDPPNESMQDLVRRQMRGDFPFMGPGDYVIVEHPARDGNPVVACACHLQEDWSIDGIPIPVGRPEIVATHPDYRRRGLIRAIFAQLHARSEAEDRPMQAITGIRYFYRQFGYEYVLDLGGTMTMHTALLPARPSEEEEACRIRSATASDVPMIAEWYREQHADSLVTCEVPDAFWRYRIQVEPEFTGHEGPTDHQRLGVIELADGEPVGFTLLPQHRRGDGYPIPLLVLKSGVDISAFAASLLRVLRDVGESVPVNKPDVPLKRLVLELGRDHPIYRVLPSSWGGQVGPPYAWYIRIPDVPGFVRRLRPALERRLADSALAGHNGELKMSFYRGGLRLVFDAGALVEVEPCDIGPYDETAKATVPPLVFSQLLLGYRSVTELDDQYPDVWVAAETRALLDTLFPKRPSHVFAF